MAERPVTRGRAASHIEDPHGQTPANMHITKRRLSLGGTSQAESVADSERVEEVVMRPLTVVNTILRHPRIVQLVASAPYAIFNPRNLKEMDTMGVVKFVRTLWTREMEHLDRAYGTRVRNQYRPELGADTLDLPKRTGVTQKVNGYYKAPRHMKNETAHHCYACLYSFLMIHRPV